MYKNFEIVPTRPAVGRLQLRAAYLAALLSTLALPGCVTFSPDGGMTVVANAADEILKNGCYFDSHGRRRGGGAQCRRRGDGDRAAGGRGHPGIGDVAIPVGDRPAEIPGGATSCR